MTKWLKEPLLHFVVLGALIFVLYEITAGDTADDDDIVVSLAQQENLARTFARTWQRPPTSDEMLGLIREYVREQIAYREATLMQLDRDDIVIRRRLRQKLELLAEDIASLAPPDEAQLQSWLDEHAADYIFPARLSVQQVFVSPDRHDDTTLAAANLLQELKGSAAADPASAGDRSLLPYSLRDVSTFEVDRVFGNGFADKLLSLPENEWSGPVDSGYGLHLVLVSDRTEPRMPDLGEVSDEVRRDWFVAAKREAVDRLYEEFARKYNIEIEQPAAEEDTAT